MLWCPLSAGGEVPGRDEDFVTEERSSSSSSSSRLRFHRAVSALRWDLQPATLKSPQSTSHQKRVQSLLCRFVAEPALCSERAVNHGTRHEKPDTQDEEVLFVRKRRNKGRGIKEQQGVSPQFELRKFHSGSTRLCNFPKAYSGGLRWSLSFGEAAAASEQHGKRRRGRLALISRHFTQEAIKWDRQPTLPAESDAELSPESVVLKQIQTNNAGLCLGDNVLSSGCVSELRSRIESSYSPGVTIPQPKKKTECECQGAEALTDEVSA
ncbi:hypothetical protein EYF80_013756 [Liparis tanakae]|uniref:Uncharacterized protein n=1 Tax=Liparis tanakae TaxID=230148 RepID=A0A4Z2IFW0_9TELE|nr:hypothetical protein EYF80_013756 [Liparis tanakae]